MPDWVPSDNLNVNDPDDLVTRVGDVLAIHEAIPHSGIPGVGEGAPAMVFYGSADPGAVGAGAIWLRQKAPGTSILVRNENDDGWLIPMLAEWYDDGGSGRHTGELSAGANAVTITAKDDDGSPAVSLSFIGVDGQIVWDAGGGVTFYSYRPDPEGPRLFAFDGLPTADPEVIGTLYTAGVPGPADPKAVMMSGGPAA